MTRATLPRLDGCSVLLTRSAEDNAGWAAELTAAGARVESLACLTTSALPVGAELRVACAGADWLVLGSRRGAEGVAAERAADPFALPPRIACVGPATRAVAARALGEVHEPGGPGRDATLAGLARAFRDTLDAPTVLTLVTADRGRRDLEELLAPAGHEVRRVELYATRPVRPAARRTDHDPRVAIVLASPSAFEGLSVQRDVPRTTPIIALGPTTRAAALAADFHHVHTAATPDLSGVARALRQLRP